MPRLASFEVYLEDGTMIFSKLAKPDGRNNYPHCFPTIAGIDEALREALGMEPREYSEEEKKMFTWGDWE